MSVIETVHEELISMGDNPDTIIGCTQTQIEEIKQIQDVVHLPNLYYEFLLKMGRGAGTLFEGSSVYYGAMKYFNFKEEAGAFLRDENVEFMLPEKAFVFIWHQNYIFFYFDTLASDPDPIIYRFQAGYKVPVNPGRFSNLLLDEIELLKRLIE